MLPTLSRLLWLWCSSSTPTVPVDTYLIQGITYIVFYLILWEMVPLLPCFRNLSVQFSQFSCSVLSNSLQPRGLQHTRLPCPSPNPRACSVIPFNHLILCRPLLLLPSIFPSIKVFSNESVLCIRWPKYLGLCIYLIHICIPGLAQTRNTFIWVVGAQ